ncbi:hypothetical protein RHMOL_Rhmol07G0252800 [Rhododendron molle]|uniref:Uncharacterized protein n=1 Tax=Rhododendron molle TaxID=49168 RepID=A0ACC0N5N7_RHOML|nr:hypothetical protein RHMOL_Rhmol07G0252800 [Rhododendron molle]
MHANWFGQQDTCKLNYQGVGARLVASKNFCGCSLESRIKAVFLCWLQKQARKLDYQGVGARCLCLCSTQHYILYLTYLAKKGDKVVENDKDLCANVKAKLMILSNVVSVEKYLYEERGKVLNLYKFVASGGQGNESEVALEDEDVELGLLLSNNVCSTQECREVLGNRDHCKETRIRGTSPPRKEQNDHQLWRCVQADLEADNGIGIIIKLVQALYARIMYHNCDVKLKGNESEKAREDKDAKLELIPNSTGIDAWTTKEFREAQADRDHCKENLIDMIIDDKRINKRLIQDDEILMRRVNREECE